MRSRTLRFGLAAALVLALALGATPALAQEPEEEQRQPGGFSECTYDFDEEVARCTNAEQAAPEEGPWWASDVAQQGLAVLALAGSVGAGGYAYVRTRGNRRTLSQFLKETESTYLAHKADPDSGVPKLATIRQEVRARFERGRLEDAQFLELDKRLTGYIARLRVLAVERRFHALPPGVMERVRTALADGEVTQADARLVDDAARAADLGERSRVELVALVREWAREDGNPEPRITITGP